MKKNVASQVVVAQLVSKTDGSAVTGGTTTCYVLGDGGTQAAGSVGSGACTHEGNGVWSYAPAQAETNYDHVAFTFVNTSAVNVTVQVYPSFPQTGDGFARLGAPAGASVSADVAAVKAVLPAALVSGRMDSSVGAMANNVLTAAAINADAITDAKVASDVTIASVTGAVGSVTGAVGSVTGLTASDVGAIKAKTDNLPSDPADASDVAGAFSTVNSTLATIAGYIDTEVGAIYSRIGAPAGASIAADIAAVKSETAAILDDTDDIGVAGAGLTALASAANLATVDTVVDAILVDTAEIGAAGAGLTALATQVSVNDLPTNAELATALGTADDAVLAQVALVKAKTDLIPAAPAAVSDIPEAADIAATVWGVALPDEYEAGTAGAIVGGLPTAAAVADAVWDEAIAGHAGAGSTGEALAAAGSAGDPWATALPGSYGAGSAGKIIGDNLNATVGSRATQTSVDTVDDFLDTEIAAIKAKTDNLPSDPADQSLVIAATDAIYNRIGAPAGASLAADMAAVQADTDNLQTRIPAALVSGRMDSSVGAVATGAIDAGAIAADAIGSSELASSAASEIATAVRTELATELARVDVAISTRLASAGYTAPDNSSITAIKAKTDNLPSDPADASDIAAAFSSVNGSLAAIGGYVDTEVAAILTAANAIKLKTDNLPSDPADASDVAAAITAALTANLTEAYAAAGQPISVSKALHMLVAILSNRDIVGTTLTARKLDGATPAATFTLDSGSAPTSQVRAS